MMMEWVFIFFGVFIGLAVFVQFLSRYHDAMDKFKKARMLTDKGEEIQEPPSGGKGGNLKIRFCPLCKSELMQHDSIYAELYDAKPRPKVIIHGCRYCYNPSGSKTNFNTNKLKKGEDDEKYH